MYVCMVECMRCGGVWHVLCVLYGGWQGRLHYPTVRVGFLTLSEAWISIPLSKSRVTVLAWPLEAASWRALRPSYNRDTQTDRQTQVSDIGTLRQTAHAKGPSQILYASRTGTDVLYVLRIYGLSTNEYVCMYVWVFYKWDTVSLLPFIS